VCFSYVYLEQHPHRQQCQDHIQLYFAPNPTHDLRPCKMNKPRFIVRKYTHETGGTLWIPGQAWPNENPHYVSFRCLPYAQQLECRKWVKRIDRFMLHPDAEGVFWVRQLTVRCHAHDIMMHSRFAELNVINILNT